MVTFQSLRRSANLLSDLPRIQHVIRNLDDLPPSLNSRLSSELQKLRNRLNAIGEYTENPTYIVNIYLAFFGTEFTRQASDEYKNYTSFHTLDYSGVRISLIYKAIFLDDLVREKWRSGNTKWRSINNEATD